MLNIRGNAILLDDATSALFRHLPVPYVPVLVLEYSSFVQHARPKSVLEGKKNEKGKSEMKKA